MKSYAFIFFFTFSFCQVIAQNWNCFPPDQKSYYRYNGYSGPAIDLIIQDSSLVSGSQQNLYFRRLIQNPGAENCRPELYPFYRNDPYYLDSLILKYDTVFYYYGTSAVYFLPSARPGQIWNLNTFGAISISCDSIANEQVFGFSDSVKYFHTSGAVSQHQIRLSLRFGFLDFIEFYNLAYNNNPVTPAHLTGVQDTSGAYGFQPPQFFDYLPYHAGDILKWDYYRHYSIMWFQPSFHFTYRDSITQVSVYPDSLVYTYDRLEIDSANTAFYFPGQTKSYTRIRHGNLLDSPPNDVGVFADDDSNFYRSVFYTSAYDIRSDTVQQNEWIERNFDWTNFDLDTPCRIIEIIDGVSPHYAFNTHQGLVVEEWDGQASEDITTLIGARINAVIYGNPDLTLSIEPAVRSGMKIYPNPVAGLLNIYAGNAAFDRLELADLFGHLVFSQRCYPGYNTMDLTELPAGIYLLKCEGKSSIIEKLMKY